MKKMCLDEVNPFWPSILSFVWCKLQFRLKPIWLNFVKFVAHESSFTNFLWRVASPRCSTQLSCCKFFVSMIIENMVYISLVYCNGVCMCVHPLWTEGVHACRCSIDRRSVAWCGATDSSVSVAIGGERRHGGTDSPASARPLHSAHTLFLLS
jgi:hypothetical protein